MTTITQAEFTRLFERIGGSLSGLKRYFDAANLVGSTSIFLFVKRDEFAFFPNPVDAFSQMTNLLRGVGYDGATDEIKFEITDIGPGTSYNLTMKRGVTTVATITGGAYGSFVTLVPSVAFGPDGKIKVTAPTGTPGANQPVLIRVVTSAVRATNDVLGETEEEGLIEAAALESHRITAGNFRKALLEAARNRVMVERTLQGLVGTKFLGTDTEDVFDEKQAVATDGSVTASPVGILPELDVVMKVNTPIQTVKGPTVTVGSTSFDFPAGGSAGVLTTTLVSSPPPGKIVLVCTRGMTVEVEDPEQFSVELQSDFLGRTVKSEHPLRPFRSFEWPKGGVRLTLTRKTLDNDPSARMTNEQIKKATPLRIPLNKLKVKTFKDVVGPINDSSTFEIIEPKSGTVLFSNTAAAGADPLPNGVHDLTLSNGLNFSFTWTNAGPGGSEEFDVEIFPYKPGDRVVQELNPTGNGLLQLELRRHFDFGFRQESGSPTIPDSVIVPDLPFIKPTLGA